MKLSIFVPIGLLAVGTLAYSASFDGRMECTTDAKPYGSYVYSEVFELPTGPLEEARRRVIERCHQQTVNDVEPYCDRNVSCDLLGDTTVQCTTNAKPYGSYEYAETVTLKSSVVSGARKRVIEKCHQQTVNDVEPYCDRNVRCGPVGGARDSSARRADVPRQEYREAQYQYEVQQPAPAPTTPTPEMEIQSWVGLAEWHLAKGHGEPRRYGPGRGADGIHRCYEVYPKGTLSGKPVADEACHLGYSYAMGSGDRLRCFRTQFELLGERGQVTFGTELPDELCTQFISTTGGQNFARQPVTASGGWVKSQLERKTFVPALGTDGKYWCYETNPSGAPTGLPFADSLCQLGYGWEPSRYEPPQCYRVQFGALIGGGGIGQHAFGSVEGPSVCQQRQI